MKNLYHRLLLLIAGSTQKELASQVRYLKIENEILRSKLPKRVPVTAKERNKLVKFGSKLGKALSELVTIVHPDTLRRWIREVNKPGKKKLAKVGRPRADPQAGPRERLGLHPDSGRRSSPPTGREFCWKATRSREPPSA
jgi:hypothetical protein